MTFKQIRDQLIKAKVIGPKCREVAPYYYSMNGSNGPRERTAGEVAHYVRCVHRALYGEVKGQKYPSYSWCGKWPRTRQSLQAEEIGTTNFWNMWNDIKEALGNG